MIPLAAGFLERLIEEVGNGLGEWAYLLVGGLAFLETGAFVGLVAPGETAVVFGGVLAGQGTLSIQILLGLVWLCAFLGDTVSYWLGHRLGRGFILRHGSLLRITPQRLEVVEGYFDRHGGKTILIGRFIGLVRALAPFLAGASRMPYRRFAPYDIVGTGLWSACFTLLGYVFWQSFDRVAAIVGRSTFLLGAVLVALVVAIVAFKKRAQLLGPLRERVLAPLGRRLRPRLLFLRDRLTPGNLGLELTTMVAVAAVGGYVFGLYAYLLSTGTATTPADREAFQLAANMRAGWLTPLVETVTYLGSTWVIAPVAIAMVAFLATRRRYVEMGVLAAGMVLDVIGYNIAKATIDRPRPVNGLVDTVSPSFPSGHAAASVVWVAIAVIVARMVPGTGRRTLIVVAGIAVAAVVGLSRVYLRAHFLSDVTSGWAFGSAVFALCAVAGLLLSHLGGGTPGSPAAPPRPARPEPAPAGIGPEHGH